MLAMAKDAKGKNILIAWGSNWRGQLGIGNKEDQYSPVRVKAADGIVFLKIVCGRDFSVGLD